MPGGLSLQAGTEDAEQSKEARLPFRPYFHPFPYPSAPTPTPTPTPTPNQVVRAHSQSGNPLPAIRRWLAESEQRLPQTPKTPANTPGGEGGEGGVGGAAGSTSEEAPNQLSSDVGTLPL